MTVEFVFERKQELQALRERVQRRSPLLIYGPAGVGKSLLLRTVLPAFPDVLYCSDSATMLRVLRSLVATLLQLRSARVVTACGRSGAEAIKGISAVNLKGLVLDALRQGHFCIVLDQIDRPSALFGSTVREVMGWASTPVIAVARSPHMEDIGSLHTFFLDRRDRFDVRNFDPTTAERFAQEAVRRAGLVADNMEEFLTRVLDFSGGNPGAILAMMEMAKQPNYWSADHIKVTPLYIDFRLSWRALKKH